jgi:hypothetical protein
MTRTRFILGVLLLGILTFALPAKGEEPRGVARLVLERTEHNFGTIDRRGGKVHTEIRLRNEGDIPLVLTRVTTSCTCLRSHFSKRPIPPGGEGVIEVDYEPLKAAPGSFNKVVQILSNSVDGRKVVTIRGVSLETKRRR